jgi:hypothetical protein
MSSCSELEETSKKAMKAYSKLINKKEQILTENSSLSCLETNSSTSFVPQISNSPRAKNRITDMRKGCADSSKLEIDDVLSEFQKSFQYITREAGELLRQSMSFPNSSTTNMLETNTRPSFHASESMVSTTSSSATDVSFILEKYADQLAKLVTDKISQNQNLK